MQNLFLSNNLYGLYVCKEVYILQLHINLFCINTSMHLLTRISYADDVGKKTNMQIFITCVCDYIGPNYGCR